MDDPLVNYYNIMLCSKETTAPDKDIYNGEQHIKLNCMYSKLTEAIEVL